MRRGPKDYRSACRFNSVCDVCGFKFKGSELRLRWDNLRVCSADYEVRHPQDFIKGIPDRQAPPFIRDHKMIFLDTGLIDSSYDDGTTITYDDGTFLVQG